MIVRNEYSFQQQINPFFKEEEIKWMRLKTKLM